MRITALSTAKAKQIYEQTSRMQCYNIKQYAYFNSARSQIQNQWNHQTKLTLKRTANADRACDLTVFADLINFASFKRNRFEFEDIMMINVVTDGPDVLVKNVLLKRVYKGQTNNKWNSDSTIPSNRDSKSCSRAEQRCAAPPSQFPDYVH